MTKKHNHPSSLFSWQRVNPSLAAISVIFSIVAGFYLLRGTHATADSSYSFKSDSLLTLAVLSVSNNTMIFLIVGGVLVLLVGGGLFLWRRHSGGDDGFSRSPYLPQTASSVPSPVSNGVTIDTPTGRRIDVGPTPGPALNPINTHNPLDRLNAMEQAPTKPADIKAPGDPSKDPADYIDNLRAPGEGMDTE